MKKYILGLITGIIIVGGISTFAYAYSASQITYTPKDNTWDVKNVASAIDDIKEKSNQHVTMVVGGDYTIPFTGMVSYINLDNKVPKKFKVTGTEGEPNIQIRCYTKRWDTYTIINLNTEYLSSSCKTVAGYVENSNYYWASFTIDLYN